MARRFARPLTAYVLAAITIGLYTATIPLAERAKLSSTVGGAFMLVIDRLISRTLAYALLTGSVLTELATAAAGSLQPAHVSAWVKTA